MLIPPLAAVRKTLALAEIAVIFQKELSNNAVAAAKMNSLIPGSGVVWLVVQDTLAVVRAAAEAAKLAGFDKGSFTGDGAGQPDASGHKVAGVVHANEWVAPAWMLQQPKYANIIGYLEAERRGSGSSAWLPPVRRAGAVRPAT